MYEHDSFIHDDIYLFIKYFHTWNQSFRITTLQQCSIIFH